jgi:hypothetical protein
MKEYKATYTDLFTEHVDPNNRSQGKVTLRADEFTLGTYHIMNWHSFDDMGASLETVQVWNPITKRLFEIYSSDEGETFTFGQPEPHLA